MLYSYFMMKTTITRREEILMTEINDIIQQIHYLPTDCSKLNTAQLLQLKKLLSPINNYITLKATYAFLNWLATHTELVNEAVLSQTKAEINSKSENSNGFDIMIPKDSPIIFAEVKCYNPVKGKERFGSARNP